MPESAQDERQREVTQLLTGVDRRVLTRGAGWLLALITGGLSVARLVVDGLDAPVAPILAVSAGCFALFGWLHRTPLAGLGLPAVGLGALGSMALVTDGLTSEAMVWLPMVPIMATALVGGRAAQAFTVGALGLVFLLGSLHGMGRLTPVEPGPLFLRVVGVASAVGFAGALGLAFERARNAVVDALGQQDARQRGLLEALPFAVVVVDQRGRIALTRNLHVAFPTTTLSCSTGDHVTHAFPSSISGRLIAALERLGPDSEPVQSRVSLGEGSTNRDLEMLLIPMPDGVAALFTDTTEEARVNRVKEEFVSVVSHELRSPLSSIYAALRMVNAGVLGRVPDTMVESLAIAEESSNRLSRLVDDLLDLQKMEAGKMAFTFETRSMREVVVAAVDGYREAARARGVRIESEADGDFDALIDADRIQQVVINLVSNAVKYSPDGGTVRVRLMTLKHGRVRLEVADEGPGIPVEARSRVFARFGQVDSSASRQVGGTGLGLAIAQGIVRRHDGAIDFASGVGKGTTFWVELPIDGPMYVTTQM